MKRGVGGALLAGASLFLASPPAVAQDVSSPAPPATWSTPPAATVAPPAPPPTSPAAETIVVRDSEGRPVDARLSVVEQDGRRVLLVTTPAPPATAVVPAETRSEKSAWPYVLLATGGTLAVTSAVFQLIAINEDSDASHYFWHSTRDDLSPSTRQEMRHSSDSHFDAAKTNQAIAITCGVLAVTAVTVAVTWLVIGRR